jgi:hypothetical protein
VDITKEQYAHKAIEFLARVAQIRLSSEYGETEKPKDPMKVLDSVIVEARELVEQEKARTVSK